MNRDWIGLALSMVGMALGVAMIIGGCDSWEGPVQPTPLEEEVVSVARSMGVAPEDKSTLECVVELVQSGLIKQATVPAPDTGGPVDYYEWEVHYFTTYADTTLLWLKSGVDSVVGRVRAIGPGGTSVWSDWSDTTYVR